jgi:DNA invertase Pin-like site-specific DNA recombinase
MGAILGYARASTSDQELEAQRKRLDDAGAIRIFEDVISGTNFEPTGLTEPLNYARSDDVLCVVRLDRLGRSSRELLETVDKLQKQGIGFMSLEERIDTISAAGKLVFQIFRSIAHFERRLIAERTRDGLRAAEAKGRKPGRPKLQDETLSSARALVEAGLSPTRAAKQLGIGRPTLYKRLLEHPAHA